MKSFNYFLLVFLFAVFIHHANGQAHSIGIIQNGFSSKSMFPVAFYTDSITDEYSNKFLTNNGKYFGEAFTRPVKLEENIDLEHLFSLFKESSFAIQFSDETKNKQGGIIVFYTNELNRVDSIFTLNYEETTALLNTFLDFCYREINRVNYDKILLSLESIKAALRPRYIEHVE